MKTDKILSNIISWFNLHYGSKMLVWNLLDRWYMTPILTGLRLYPVSFIFNRVGSGSTFFTWVGSGSASAFFFFRVGFRFAFSHRAGSRYVSDSVDNLGSGCFFLQGRNRILIFPPGCIRIRIFLKGWFRFRVIHRSRSDFYICYQRRQGWQTWRVDPTPYPRTWSTLF